MNSSYMFIVSLAAVINGLGIVRILSGVSELIQGNRSKTVNHYWLYAILVVFQLLAHVLYWWNLVALRETESINFIQYLVVLVGPTLLYLATSTLMSEPDSDNLDFRVIYWGNRKPYYLLMMLFMAWGISIWPVLGYSLSPSWKVAAGLFVAMTILRFSSNERVHQALVGLILVLLLTFIVVYSMQLGAIGQTMTQ